MGASNFADVYLVNFGRTVGAEIRKTRPAAVIFPEDNEQDRTVLVAPMTTKGLDRPHPLKVKVYFNGKEGRVLLKQMKAVDKSRFVKYLGQLSTGDAKRVSAAFGRMANRLK